jgi:hypothetical protein
MSEDLTDGFNMDTYGTSFGNDNDNRHEIYPIRNIYGPSEEDRNELNKDAPSFSARKVPRNQRMKVTIDMACEESMKQLVKEIEFSIDSKLTDKFGSRQPCFDELINEFFGERSELYKVFEKHLPNLNFERYSRWVTTMFGCLAYGKSIEDLYSKYSFIDKHGLASPEEYKALWKDISMACLDVSSPGRPKARRDVKPFWQHVQDALKGMLHEWCIEGFDDGTSKRQEMCHR